MAEARRTSKSDPGQILREVLQQGVTGCLTLRAREGGDHRVYLMQGEILACHAPDDGRQVIRRLVNNGALTESQGATFAQRVAAGERLDDLLYGQVPDDLLGDLMAARFRQNLQEFLGQPGTPNFEPMEAIFVDNIQTAHDTLRLLGDLEARRQRTRPLRVRLQDVTIRPGRGRPSRLEEARLLDLCDGVVRLRDFVGNSPFEEGETLDLIYEMIETGVLRADGYFPSDDDEPTEVGAEPDEELIDIAASALEPLDAWTEDAPRLGPVPSKGLDAGAWGQTSQDETTAAVEVESDEVELTMPTAPTPSADAVAAALAAEELLRQDAELALRAEMERELTDEDSTPDGASVVRPPGFDYDMPDDVDLSLFEDVDREVGRGRGEGSYVGSVKDLVEVPELPSRMVDEDGIIEASSIEELTDEERAQVKTITFGAPVLEDTDVRRALEVVNRAMRDVARTFDENNGPGSGQALVQILIEGTPAEFNALFRGVDARKDGAIPIEMVLRNLRERPKSEHRQLVHRGVEDLLDRALTLSCDELEDEAADFVTARVLMYQKQIDL